METAPNASLTQEQPPELPNLKAKEKEARKKRGAGAWFWRAGPGSGEFAAGGAGEAGSDFLGVEGAAEAGEASGGSAGAAGGSRSLIGRIFGPGGWLNPDRAAASLANLFGPASRLGVLFATEAGARIVAGAMLAWAILMVTAGAAFLKHLSARPDGPPQLVALGGVGPDGLSVRRPGDAALSDFAAVNRGELQPEPAGPEESKFPAEARESRGTPDRKEAPDAARDAPGAPMPAQSWGALGKGGGAAALDGSRGGFNLRKLTTDPRELGAATAAAASGRAATAAGSAARVGAAPKLRLAPGALEKLRAASAVLTGAKASMIRARSFTGMGQLKFANDRSVAGANSSSIESSHGGASDAFEQQATQGGGLSGPGASGIGGSGNGTDAGPGAETVVPPGTGVTQPTLPPQVAPPTNVTPYQNDLNAAQGLGDMAAKLKMTGMMLMIMALALIAIGCRFLAWPMTPFGVALIAMGAMLMMTAMGMMNAASKMAAEGQQIGQQIQNGFGQTDQGAINSQCMSQAANNGTSTTNCSPTDRNPQTQLSNQPINDHLSQEQNSTYQLGGGGDGSPGGTSGGNGASPARPSPK